MIKLIMELTVMKMVFLTVFLRCKTVAIIALPSIVPRAVSSKASLSSRLR